MDREQTHGELSASELSWKVMVNVRGFAAETEFGDDITLVVIKRTRELPLGVPD